MAIPSLRAQFDALLKAPSISCTQADMDQSNLGVIHLLADWLGFAGFQVHHSGTSPTKPGKANLIAILGTGPGGLVLAGHTDTVPCNPERWQHDPFKLTESDGALVRASAVCDMKGFFR